MHHYYHLTEVIDMARELTEEEVKEILDPKNLAPYYQRLVEKARRQGATDKEIAEDLVELS